MARFQRMSTDGRAERNGAQVKSLLGKFWTVANALSLVRLLLVIPVTYLILTGGSAAYLWALLAAVVVSDFFDGRVARWSHTVSEWGKVLDPLADKAAAIAVTLALVVRNTEPTIPIWFVALVAGRDVLIVLGGFWLARKRSVVVMSTMTGKIAVTAIALTIVATLLGADPDVMAFCIWTTTVLLIVSFVAYATRYVRLMRGYDAPPRID
ncbi:MAG TPA: CDP-alcohol phosphatidyltransferase family protein, partial [Rhodothermales bacterium]